jgi:hypothetical protein
MFMQDNKTDEQSKNYIKEKLIITNPIMQSLIKIFLGLIVGFYPLAMMYKEEYQIIPLRLESVVVSMLMGLFFNTGLILTLTDFGLIWRKTTMSFLLLSALSSWFIFYFPAANPTSSLSDERWFMARHFLSYGSLGFILFTIGLLARVRKNDS